MPMYSVWFEKKMIDTTTPTSMATGPAQFSYFVSNSSGSSSPGLRLRRSSRLQNITASHGAIQ
jgi:hypothetical protein